MLAPIKAINNAGKKHLKGKYASNPKKPGERGYNADDSAPVKRVKKSV